MPSLSKILWKWLVDVLFVKMSASWSPVLTYGVQMMPLRSFSLINFLSISICFVQSCRIGLWAILIAALLSQNGLMGSLMSYPSSLNNIFIHNISHIPWAIALNSASALDLATTNCFLLCQVTKLSPTNKQYPEVERRSIIDPTQSAFV